MMYPTLSGLLVVAASLAVPQTLESFSPAFLISDRAISRSGEQCEALMATYAAVKVGGQGSGGAQDKASGMF